MKNKFKTCFILGTLLLFFIGLTHFQFVGAQQNSLNSPNDSALSNVSGQANGLNPSNDSALSNVSGQANGLNSPNDSALSDNFRQLNGSATLSGRNDSTKSSLDGQSQTNALLPDQSRSSAILPNQTTELIDPSPLSNPTDLTHLIKNPQQLISNNGIQSSLGIVLLITILSLAPAILIMTTSFVRIMTVLSILREAIGAGQLPPNQVLTALSLFLTLLIMTPVWTQVYNNAIVPYSNQEIDAQKALDEGILPIRTFMCQQIERRGNGDDIRLFMQYIPEAQTPEFYEDVPLRALLPAFMLSELKTAFLIGFQLFIPFLIIDMIVSGVLVSMGMMMLPPVMISLPFKLMLFVLMDGWTLVVKMILDSFTLLIS